MIKEELENYLKDTDYQYLNNEYIIYHKNEEVAPLHIKVKDQALFMYCQILISGASSKLLKSINKANLYTTYGNFDYNPDTGDIYYRCSLDLSGRSFSFKQCVHLCNAPMTDLPVLKKQL